LTAKRSASSSVARSDRAPPALVLLDTNALFLPWSTVDRLREEVSRQVGDARLALPSTVLIELDRLEARGLRSTVVARRLAAGLPILEAGPLGDGDILVLARRRHAWVLTSDRAFRTRLVDAGLRVLYPRHGGGLVVFEGPPPAAGPRRARATVKNRAPVGARSRGQRHATR